MPRKLPTKATGVIEFFQTAELAVAQAILSVAGDTVRQRSAPKAAKTKAPKVPTATPPVNEAKPITAPKVKKSKKTAEGPGPVAEVG